MRKSAFLRSFVVCLSIASQSVLFAQFQAPTDEELKMTSDPKAPGAAAVYLDFEETTDDLLHYYGIYARIKILQEKGKELATVELPYLKSISEVAGIEGRTIHSDGVVVPLTGKPEDLLVAKTGDMQLKRKVFTLPSVEVGSIIEYRYRLRYDEDRFSSPDWEIQKPYFVHKAHYVFTPFKAFLHGSDNETYMFLVDGRGNRLDSLLWTWILPPGVLVKSDAVGRHSVDLTDIPPIPNEEWMPPRDSFYYHVHFYYQSARNIKDYWEGETKLWSKDVDHFAEPSDAIRNAVAGLVAPSDTDMDKARKLYKAVQALDNTDFSRAKGKTELKKLNLRGAKRAEDTWTQMSGDSHDITLLYLAMLRAAGITAYDMEVVDRERGTFNLDYLDFDQLDDDIIIASAGGKKIVLDPGEKMCPFQTVHWRHSGAGGVWQSPDGRSAADSPAQLYSANTLVRIGDINVDGHGAITGLFHFVMTGQEALKWRQLSLNNDDGEVKRQFSGWVESMLPEGIEVQLNGFSAMDDPDSNLVAEVKVEGSLGAATSKRLLLPGFFFETRGSHPFVDLENRQTSVDMHYGEQVTDQVVYHLPAGLSVEGAPQDTEFRWEGHAAFATRTKSEPGKVTVIRQLIRGFTFAKPEEYQDLRGFYQKVAAGDQQQLVLSLAPAAQGN